MNFRNTLAGFALAVGTLFPGQVEAKNPHPESPYSHPDSTHPHPEAHPTHHHHPHHLALGAEVHSHAVLANVLYTYELVRHWSAGANVGFGTDYHGNKVGSLKAMATFHHGIGGKLYFVGEAGVGVESGKHIEPVAEVAAMVGRKVSENMGAALGIAAIGTPRNIQPAGVVSVAFGF